MSIVFLYYGFFFRLLNLVGLVLTLIIIYKFARALLYSEKVPKYVYAFLLIVGILIILPSSVEPKFKISNPTNIAQKIYDTNDENIQIITPPPRVKYMNGFKPLSDTK